MEQGAMRNAIVSFFLGFILAQGVWWFAAGETFGGGTPAAPSGRCASSSSTWWRSWRRAPVRARGAGGAAHAAPAPGRRGAAPVLRGRGHDEHGGRAAFGARAAAARGRRPVPRGHPGRGHRERGLRLARRERLRQSRHARRGEPLGLGPRDSPCAVPALDGHPALVDGVAGDLAAVEGEQLRRSTRQRSLARGSAGGTRSRCGGCERVRHLARHRRARSPGHVRCRGSRRAACACRGGAAPRTGVPLSAISTMRPRYITPTRSRRGAPRRGCGR